MEITSFSGKNSGSDKRIRIKKDKGKAACARTVKSGSGGCRVFAAADLK